MSGLLSNPPLLDRITWREGIYPRTLISEDRGLMARTFGTLYLLGAMVGFLLVAVGEHTDARLTVLVALCSLATCLGALCFLGYRRLSPAFFYVLLALGSVMISVATLSASQGAEGAYGFYYVWVVLLALLFFPPRAAAAQCVLAALLYGSVLHVTEAPFAFDLVVSGVATLGATGVIMGLVRARLEALATDLASAAHTDPVTAIANRRAFNERLRTEIDRAQRGYAHLSLMVCDLDRFKAVNDALGHEEGDAALWRAAAAIERSIRAADLVARLGGEEFAVLLPDTDSDLALRVAERVRLAIRSEFESYPVPLTVSCGLASEQCPASGGQALLRAADAALYAAKRAGRDCTIADPGAGAPPSPALVP